MNRQAFFASLRERNSGVFGTSISQSQVAGLAAILDEGEKRKTPLKHMAYILATAYHEVGGKMQPVREGFASTDAGARKAVANLAKKRGPNSAVAKYAKPDPVTGQVYYGRGFVQLTWKANYEKAGKKLGFDLVREPDLAMGLRVATEILFSGMEDGWFTGKRLSDYSDYHNMRRIINGTDAAGKIAGHADAFERALRAGEWGLWKQPAPKPIELAKPVDVPAPQKPAQMQPSGAGAKSLLVLLAAAGGALWAKWEAFTAWAAGWF